MKKYEIRIKHWLLMPVILLGLMGVSACDIGVGQTSDDAKNYIRPVKIAVAKAATTDVVRHFPGVTEATHKSFLAFRVSGQVAELAILEGVDVKKGDLIARLDDTDYKNTLADRKARFELAKTKLDRQKKLFKQSHSSQSALDEAKAQFEIAKTNLKRAQDDIQYTRLLAPYDGTIAKVDVKQFQNIPKDKTIIEFHGNKLIDVNFSVPEELFLKSSPKTKDQVTTLIRFSGRPDVTYQADFRKLELVPDRSTRAYEVTVTMPMPTDVKVLPGMTANIELRLPSKFADNPTGGILIPIEAIFEQEGKTWVWRLTEASQAEKIEVTAGEIIDAKIQILSGIKDGDRIIAAGTSQIYQGLKVRPLSRERGL